MGKDSGETHLHRKSSISATSKMSLKMIVTHSLKAGQEILQKNIDQLLTQS